MEQNFPELRGKISGANYPPPPLIELVMKAVSFVQLMGIVFAMMGSNVFRVIGFQQVPSWYASVEMNAVPIAIFMYLLLPQILSGFVVSGAFEIMLDTTGAGFGDDTNSAFTVFSKLATGKLPATSDLIEPLVQAGLKYVGGTSAN
mmetsp:Transcript_7964/g.19956  ORF Transcript_7964/g.19956 Transcript_7964/m.19956 type:complete len:146 (+) Transcript_7964:378-815(+)